MAGNRIGFSPCRRQDYFRGRWPVAERDVQADARPITPDDLKLRKSEDTGRDRRLAAIFGHRGRFHWRDRHHSTGIGGLHGLLGQQRGLRAQTSQSYLLAR